MRFAALAKTGSHPIPIIGTESATATGVLQAQGVHALQAQRRLLLSVFEDDLNTPLPRKLTFATPDKVLQLVERAGGLKDLAARQAIEHGIKKGRGGVYLMLTSEQYDKLKHRQVIGHTIMLTKLRRGVMKKLGRALRVNHLT